MKVVITFDRVQKVFVATLYDADGNVVETQIFRLQVQLLNTNPDFA